MDDFAVDLDKVLDDFELSEGASGPKTETKVNHGNGLPSLQQPISGGNLYSSSQAVPLQPPYTQGNAIHPNYRQAQPMYNNQYDMTYQHQTRTGEYTLPQAHAPVIDGRVQSEVHRELIHSNSTPASNSQLDQMSHNDRLAQTSLPHVDTQHHDNRLWSTVVNNNMTQGPVMYGTDGGVLAHGERSNGNILRRLSDERPELLQSMEEKPVTIPPYPGDINTSQAYPGGMVVSQAHPDVVPVSLNMGLDRESHPTGMNVQTDLDLKSSTPSDPPVNVENTYTAMDSSTGCLSNGDLPPAVPFPDRSLKPLQIDPTTIYAVTQNSPEKMNIDSPQHTLQTEKSDNLSEVAEDHTVKPIAEVSNPEDIQKDFPMYSAIDTSTTKFPETEVLSQDDQCNALPQEDSAVQMTTSDTYQPEHPAAVGFGDIEGNICDDEIDTYLADLETTDSDNVTPSLQLPKTSICPSSLDFPKEKCSVTDQSTNEVQSSSNQPDSQDGETVEKFLAPSIMSPRIATPMEDPGFSKVPGYVPPVGMPSLQEVPTVPEEEEEEEEEGDQQKETVDRQDHPIQTGDSVHTDQNDNDSNFSPQVPVTTQSTQEITTTSKIETDHVMSVEKATEDPSTALTVGAITVSFPVQEKAQPMDTSTSSLPGALQEAGQVMAGTGARPKEITQRKSRPNSLLGLSKPDLNITVSVPSTYENHDSGYSEAATSTVGLPAAAASGCLDQVHSSATSSVVENSHDIINRQLAQKAWSPLQKKQLNLEIKQHLDNVATQQQIDAKKDTYVETGSQLSGATVSVVTNRAQLASGIGITLPSESGSLIRADSGLQEDITSSSSSSSLLSTQTPSPARAVNPQLATEDHVSNVWQKQEQDQQQDEEQQQLETQSGAIGGSEEGLHSAKLKRPTSLSLRPRSEFQLNQDKDSTEDDSITGDGGYASSGSSNGHLTPFQADSEMSEPAGATASGPEMMYSPPEVGPGAFSPAPRCSSNTSVVITQLGRVAPRWVPDAEATNCMQCEARFTFTKRRHHCRACGKVFCSACCNLKCKLQYMDNKEARVCSKCYQDIVRGSQRSREPKQVMFSDGIRPGGDLTELDGSDARIPIRRHRSSKKVERTAAAAEAGSSEAATKSPSPKTRVKRLSEPSLRHACLIPETGLPPIIMSTGVKGDFTLEEDPSPEAIMPKIRSTEDPNPVVFAINKNLFVLVKIVNLDCCLNRVCWCFCTKGMCTVGQDEVVIVLECLPDEKNIPRDIFCHFNSVFDEAGKGNTVSHLGHTIFGQSFLDSRDHCGFLYVRPTFQCTQKLLLPQPPYVFGLLLQKWETPWAKVFPVRLMLRLGAEYRYYPCPLISVRFRKPVYGEIGHTIMNLLADFRNYQYMLPQTRGVVVHMEEKKTFINFPRNRYEEVMKVITNSNDHVMALGANFSTDADSHLVCIQNEDGNYQTQAINIQNKPRKVTGASFVVFNGALKTSSGLRAKSSIVEDGLMVQITSEMMGQLKAALLDMKDFTISCGALDVPMPEEQVIVQWVEDDHKVNIGVKSPIDGLPMDGIESIHIHNGTDYVGETRTIRWTEVFFIQNEDSSNSRCEPVDLSRLAETLAQACCIALTPHLDKLKEAGLTKIGLRCTIDRDQVGYEVGANSERLPDHYMNDLDNELIPVIHNAGSQNQDGPVVLELIFYIIE